MPKSGRELERRRRLRRERLREALHSKGWNKWRFHRLMERQRVPGASRASIDRYLKGASPPVEFLVAASEVLEVPLLWLLGESNVRTREEAAKEEGTLEALVQGFNDEVKRTLRKAFPPFERLPWSAWGPVWNVWLAQYGRGWNLWVAQHGHGVAQRIGEGAEGAPSTEDISTRIGRALMGPLKALGVDVNQLSERQLEQYTVALCTALTFVRVNFK